MMAATLVKDPFNLVISGVAGQGNIVVSLLLGTALVNAGYKVMFGQTFGSSQRGGSVRNYLRVSKDTMYSPVMPSGRADAVISMEPGEALRMLVEFGNPAVVTVVNSRTMASGSGPAADPGKLMSDIRQLSARVVSINATDEALKLGNPVLANIVVVGAVIGAGILPVTPDAVIPDLKERFPRAVEVNMRALERGIELARGQ